MKKWIFAIILMMFASWMIAAGESGDGTQSIAPSSAVVDATTTALTWTYTVATHNMAGGVVVFKFPNGQWAGTAPTVTSTAAVLGTLSAYWQESGVTYCKVTVVSATVADTIVLTVPKVKCPDLVGANGFTILQATDSTDMSDVTSIAANTTLTVSAVGEFISSAPTPVILTTYNGVQNVVVNANQAITTGYLKVTLPNSSWGPISVATAAAGYVSITAAIGMPTPIVATDGLSMVIAVPTLAANQKVTVTFPSRAAVTPAVGGLKTTYGINQQFNVALCNAIYTATTQSTPTPANTPKSGTATYTASPTLTTVPTRTAAQLLAFAQQTFTARTPAPTVTGTVSVGKWDVWVATPTVVLTVTYSDDGRLIIYGTGNNPSLKTIQFGTSGGMYSLGTEQATGYITVDPPALYGSYTITYLTRWRDALNDGEWRTNTKTTTYYKLPIFLSKAQAYNDGLLTRESFMGISVKDASAPLFVTKYAVARYMAYADVWSNTNPATFVVANQANSITYCAIALPSTGAYGNPTINPVFAAETYIYCSKTAGADNIYNGIFYTIPLPTR